MSETDRPNTTPGDGAASRPATDETPLSKPESKPEPRPEPGTPGAPAAPDAPAGSDARAASSGAPGPSNAPGAGQSSGAANPDAPNPSASGTPPGSPPPRPEQKLPINPKRVRGGVRLKRREGGPEAWTEQRVWRLVEQAADGDQLKEGLEYARGGQTRRIDYAGGKAEASVQGRRPRAYITRLSLPHFSPDDAARSIRALGEQSRFAAKLLAGELPPTIDDVFAPLGLSIFPADGEEFVLTCSCKEEHRWCKHAVCVAALLAEKMAEDPFLVFEFRGIDKENLVEGLREQRSLGAAGPGPTPVYAAHVAGLSDTQPASLEDEAAHFWRSRPGAEFPSTAVETPEVSHPLLRRLGPSPFQESKFPLVGLLATCYDLIGEEAIRAENEEPENEEPENEEPAGGFPADGGDTSPESAE